MKIALLALVLFAAIPVHEKHRQQPDWSKVQIKSTKIAGNVYLLEGAGGNIGVSVGADGILIVGDQFAPLADKIRASLKTLGQGKLRFILNTHWHGDHTGGNAAFGQETTIVAHDNVRKRMSTEQRSEFFKSTNRCPFTSTAKRYAPFTSRTVTRTVTLSSSSPPQTWSISATISSRGVFRLSIWKAAAVSKD